MTALVALACGAALAGGFEVAQQSAANGGVAHAGTGRVDAASAWANPAALADDGGFRGAVGGSVAVATIRAEATAEDPSGPWSTKTRPNASTPPFLHASWSGHGLTAGLAAGFAFAGGTRWPEDGPQRFEIIESGPRFLRVAPFVGGRIGPVRLAVGGHVDAGELAVRRATDHVVREGSAHLLLHGAGVGIDASAWVGGPTLSVGVSYKGRTRLNLAGDAVFDVPDAFRPRFPDQGVTARWTLPERVVLGLAWDTGAAVLLADVGLTGWSVNDALTFALEDSDDLVQRNDWRDSLAVRLGAEVPRGRWVLRGGLWVDGVTGPPVPASTLSPSSPDSTRVGATVGAGRTVGVARIDGYTEHLRLLPRMATGLDAPIARYDGWAQVVGIGVTLPGRGAPCDRAQATEAVLEELEEAPPAPSPPEPAEPTGIWGPSDPEG